MGGYRCPFCNEIMSISRDTHNAYQVGFYGIVNVIPNTASSLCLQFYKCPNCGKISVFADGLNGMCDNQTVNIYPRNLAIRYPDYIPLSIRSDYEEAVAISDESPKAAATLARRCLQGMIHDYWSVFGKNLNEELTALRDKLSPDLWESIDNLRKLGNIGAHMERDVNTIVDIDPNEAKTLLRLIELLMKEWYITREQRKKLFRNIGQIAQQKEADRKK